MIQSHVHLLPSKMAFHILMVGKGSRSLQRGTNMIFPVYLHRKGRGKVLSVGLFFSRAPLQALYVLVNLRLEISTKLSCCVVPHQALYVTLHLQRSIKKLSFVSPSTFLFVTLMLILKLLSLCQDLHLKHTEFPTDTPT